MSIESVNSSEKVIRRLYQITNNYDAGFDAQINQLIKMGLERFNLDIGILARIQGNHYVVKHCVAPPEMTLSPGAEFDLSNTYCQIACKTNAPTALEYISQHDQYASHPAYKAFGLESYVGIPIHVNGTLYGTLNFSSPRPYPRKFKEVDIDALQLMSSWVSVELIRRAQETKLIELNQRLEQQVYEDYLTEIPNRRAVFQHVASDIERIRHHDNIAVLAIIDIDFFKRVNDTYGHKKGDEILIQVAQAINKHKRADDFLARFGGEEFILWLPHCNITDAKRVCLRIKDNIEKLAITDAPITVSFGATSYIATQYISRPTNTIIDQLISEADNALYCAKDAGRNCIKFHGAS